VDYWSRAGTFLQDIIGEQCEQKALACAEKVPNINNKVLVSDGKNLCISFV